MGEIQPCPGESDGGNQAQRLGQRAMSPRAQGEEQARWGQMGQASQKPLGPHPNHQAQESRGQG